MISVHARLDVTTKNEFRSEDQNKDTGIFLRR